MVQMGNNLKKILLPGQCTMENPIDQHTSLTTLGTLVHFSHFSSLSHGIYQNYLHTQK